uniref:Leucine-rich repeat-containing N-terminal plant-type domain-containing protein n=1 Tax=Salix viminalis TaxID=40686 RepID=A0A6N2N4S8_SALVM
MKDSLNYPNGTSLPSWRKVDTRCCDWERVVCSSSTDNEIYAEEDDHNLSPKFQLESLYLSSRGQVAGAFPKFLYHQFNLQSLDLTNIQIKGEFPTWLMENNTYLKSLYLENCSLSGPFLLPRSSHVNLSFLSISMNHFQGQIPAEIGAYFPGLQVLLMSDNGFDGSIPSSLGSMTMRILSNNSLPGKIPGWIGNMSSLEFLDLSRNNLSGPLPPRFSASSKLRYVYLSRNKIPEWIGRLYNLRFLLLSHNNFEGEIPVQLCKLDQLNLIDLSHNYLSGNIISWMISTPPFPTKTLIMIISHPITTKNVTLLYKGSTIRYFSGIDFSCNNFTGEIPPEIGILSKIKVLNLSHNSLIGPIPATFSRKLGSFIQQIGRKNPPQLTGLYSLAVFNVAHNNLSGKTPARVAQFATFEESSYKDNPFLCGQPLIKTCDVDMPSSPMSNNEEKGGFMDMELRVAYIMVLLVIGAILYIDSYWRLAWFHFIEVSIPNCYYFMVDNLTNSLNYPNGTSLPSWRKGDARCCDWDRVECSSSTDNEIYAEEDDHNLSPKFQLESLYLSSHGLVAGAFPKFLYNQFSLQSLNLTNIQIKGEFPSWLMENNTYLQELSLENCSLSGSFLLPRSSHGNLSFLSISMNSFQGQIPAEIGAYFPGLQVLLMSHSGFDGSIPSSLGNNLSGPLPPRFGASSELRYVYLSRNKLQGPIATEFYNSSNILALDLSHNNLTGRIPEWIGRLSNLRFLLLSHNNLEGEIPVQLCRLKQLTLIDLSHNYLSGNILSWMISTHPIPYHNTSYDSLSSTQQSFEFTTKNTTFLYTGSIIQNFSGIDLSCNNFTGEIPPEIGNLSTIKVLNLSHNSLIGPIPPTFSRLEEIESLDLSYNKLEGEIPPQLTGLYYLAVFSVAHNNLSGKTPSRVAQFATFDDSSYEDNPFLCGQLLAKDCYADMPSSPTPTSTSTNNKDNGGFMDMEAFYVSFEFAYMVVLLVIGAVLVHKSILATSLVSLH